MVDVRYIHMPLARLNAENGVGEGGMVIDLY